MGISLKRSHACTATLSAPNPAADHHQRMPPPETPGYPQASPRQSACGITAPFSWVLVHKVLLYPPTVYFPVLCKSSSSMVGLMATSSKRAYEIMLRDAGRAGVILEFSSHAHSILNVLCI